MNELSRLMYSKCHIDRNCETIYSFTIYKYDVPMNFV